MFFLAKEDSLLPREHVTDVFEQYAGEKKLVEVSGDHNSFRGEDFYSALSVFLVQNFKLDVEPFKFTPVNDNTFFAQIIPFVIVEAEEGDIQLDHGKFMNILHSSRVHSPVVVSITEDRIIAVNPFTNQVVSVIAFSEFSGLQDSGMGMVRVMVADGRGYLISCNFASTMMQQLESAINKAIQDQFLNDMPAFLDRVKRAARKMLAKHSVETVSKMIEDVMVADVMKGEEEELKQKLSEEIRKAVLEVSRE